MCQLFIYLGTGIIEKNLQNDRKDVSYHLLIYVKHIK